MGKQSEATPFGDTPRIARLASPRKKATSTTTPSGAARGRKQSGTHARATPATAFFSRECRGGSSRALAPSRGRRRTHPAPPRTPDLRFSGRPHVPLARQPNLAPRVGTSARARGPTSGRAGMQAAMRGCALTTNVATASFERRVRRGAAPRARAAPVALARCGDSSLAASSPSPHPRPAVRASFARLDAILGVARVAAPAEIRLGVWLPRGRRVLATRGARVAARASSSSSDDKHPGARNAPDADSATEATPVESAAAADDDSSDDTAEEVVGVEVPPPGAAPAPGAPLPLPPLDFATTTGKMSADPPGSSRGSAPSSSPFVSSRSPSTPSFSSSPRPSSTRTPRTPTAPRTWFRRVTRDSSRR